MKARVPLILTLLTGSLAAQPPSPVQSRLELPENGVWVGQQVVLGVELSVPTHFSGAPAFDLPRVPGAMVLKTSASPTLSARTVEDREYAIARHEILIYPQRAGEVVIPPFPVRFKSSSLPGQEDQQLEGKTAEARFTAKLPPEAENLARVVTTDSLEVSESWRPLPANMAPRVGDAFTRTVTLKANQVPGMVLAAIPAEALEGLRAYVKEPQITDSVNRGSLTGQRTDTISYLCMEPGTVTLPALTYVWWNPTDQTLHRETLPGVTLSIVPAPAPPETAAQRRIHWLRMLAPAGLAAIAMAFAWKPLLMAWNRWRTHRRASEPIFFRKLLAACRRNDPKSALRALEVWRERLGPINFPLSLAEEIARLERSIFGPEPTPVWSGYNLIVQLRVARNSLLPRSRRPRSGSALASLNPTSTP